MPELISVGKRKEKAVLVALINQHQTEQQTREYLEELAFLASTLDVETVKMFTQKLELPDVRTFVGKGKLEEIRTYVKAMEVDIVIFDDDLTPSQLRNLEKQLEVTIFDRSLLILAIFLKRAKTSQARTQVELARYEYLLPRLTRMWTHLERQRGGTGTRGGAGEKEIETDRRIIRDKIALLKKKLEKIDRQNATQRKSRSAVTRVALVGYTNVGKSTLMTLLSRSEVFAEDKLFATVDSTVRKVVINRIPFLLSDTVGFIRKLPHTLVESFKSTLDEIREADILVHIVDVSHPGFEEQIDIVNSTLKEIDASDKPTLLVFNKIDLYRRMLEQTEENIYLNGEESLSLIRKHYAATKNMTTVFISARNNENIQDLRDKLGKMVAKRHYMIYPNYLKNEIY
ncbi:MAG: GTPase HflX [Cyclobacteriaceae bacterium]|nr:GTPase HflX [Cyclobacteriaceae bacterium]